MDPRSRVCVSLGISPDYASSIPLVLSITILGSSVLSFIRYSTIILQLLIVFIPMFYQQIGRFYSLHLVRKLSMIPLTLLLLLIPHGSWIHHLFLRGSNFLLYLPFRGSLLLIHLPLLPIKCFLKPSTEIDPNTPSNDSVSPPHSGWNQPIDAKPDLNNVLMPTLQP